MNERTCNVCHWCGRDFQSPAECDSHPQGSGPHETLEELQRMVEEAVDFLEKHPEFVREAK